MQKLVKCSKMNRKNLKQGRKYLAITRKAASIMLAAILAVILAFTISPIESFAKDSLTAINVNSFKNPDKITTLHIGKDVKQISSNSFVNMFNLKEITVSSDNRYYSSYSGCLYDKKQTTLLCFPQARQSAYIPDSVVAIGEDALDGVSTDLKELIQTTVAYNSEAGENEEDIINPHLVHTANGLMWDDGKGNIVSVNDGLLLKVASFVESNTTNGMRQNEQLKSCYEAIIDTITYSDYYYYPQGNWTAEKALSTLSSKQGDSYGISAAFAYVAASLGYKTRVIVGVVTNSDGISQASAWVQVEIDGTYYVFDPAMEKNLGEDCYKIPTGADVNGIMRKNNASYTVVF